MAGDKDKKPEDKPEPKPELPPSQVREDHDPRQKVSEPTRMRRRGAEVIKGRKKGKK